MGLAALDDDVRRWRDWIEGPISSDVVSMHHKRHVWREVGAMLEARPWINDVDLTFWEFVRHCYSDSQAIAIRRQADRDPRSCSLARLIEEVRDDADKLTREYFTGLWDRQDGPHLVQLANKAFDQLAGSEHDHLDRSLPERDLARLGSDAAKMRAFVNEHVAHDAAEPTTEMPTFDDLNAAIDALGQLFRKYAHVLTAGSYVTLEPVIQGNWKQLFREPWLERA